MVLVKQAYFDDEVVPNKQGSNFADRASAEDNEGGYVKEPEKGLHKIWFSSTSEVCTRA